jgi:hypothetical protein
MHRVATGVCLDRRLGLGQVFDGTKRLKIEFFEQSVRNRWKHLFGDALLVVQVAVLAILLDGRALARGCAEPLRLQVDRRTHAVGAPTHLGGREIAGGPGGSDHVLGCERPPRGVD